MLKNFEILLGDVSDFPHIKFNFNIFQHYYYIYKSHATLKNICTSRFVQKNSDIILKIGKLLPPHLHLMLIREISLLS